MIKLSGEASQGEIQINGNNKENVELCIEVVYLMSQKKKLQQQKNRFNP